MKACELTPQLAPTDDQFDDEQEGIELVKRRVSQIDGLRARIKELVSVPHAKRNAALTDELSLSVFRLYEARFMLDKLVAKLRRLRKQRKDALLVSTSPYDAPTAPKPNRPATQIAARPS
jgi:hypothetical protein